MKKFLCFCLLWSSAVVGGNVWAKEEYFEAQVTQVLEEKSVVNPGSDEPQVLQNLQLQITSGERKGETIQLENGNLPVTQKTKYESGDKVVVYHEPVNDNYLISDLVRRPTLVWLAVIFVVAAVVVGHWQGLTSLLGLGLSFVIIFYYVLPRIAAGGNPIVIVISSCLVIVPVIFVLAHGWHKKTWVAMTATLLAMLVTGGLIVLFVNQAGLTGMASEEAGFLAAMHPGLINLKNLLIAGMLVATLGVLDDVTVSQAAVVSELKQANPELTFGQLYSQASKIGRDHIASMINTLILAYAGASFPLLLLFVDSELDLNLTLNYEIIADEIVHTLTGSIGLIAAVPLTTALAAAVERWSVQPAGKGVTEKVKEKSQTKD